MYNNRYIVLYFIVVICLLFNYSEAVLPEFKVCQTNFDDPQQVITLGVPDFQIEQSGPVFRLFSKTPINKYVFREEFIELSIIWIGEIEEYEAPNTFHDRFNLTSQGTLCRSYLTESDRPTSDDTPLSSKQIIFDVQTTNGCNMSMRVEFFNTTAILLTDKDIPVSVSPGEAKLSFDIFDWPFDSLENQLTIRILALVHAKVIVDPKTYITGPADENYPETTTLYSNVTVNNSSYAIGIQGWSVQDNEYIVGAASSAPEVIVTDEGIGSYYNVYFQSFSQKMAWDPSISILFFGDETILTPSYTPNQPESTQPPTSTPSPHSVSPTDAVGGVPPPNNSGLYIGVILAVVVLAMIIGGGIFVYTTRKRNITKKKVNSMLVSAQQREQSQSQQPN